MPSLVMPGLDEAGPPHDTWPFRRIEETTLMLEGEEADRELGSAK